MLNLSEFVSIILPTYNRADKLEGCITSVLLQNYSNFELIVSDDGSTDNTQMIVGRLMKNDPRIQYSKNDNRKGLPANRNVAISKSRGNYIFFIEDDMVLDPNCLEILMGSLYSLKLQKIKIGGITPSLLAEYKDGKSNRNMLNYACRESNARLEVPCKWSKITGMRYYNFSREFDRLQEVPDMHACSLYPRALFEEVGGYDERRYKGNFLYEETDVNYRIHTRGYKFYFEPKAILYHKITKEGGCRVDTLKYGYFFILNHIKFVKKNFGLKSIYMLPSFLFLASFIMIKSNLSRFLLLLKRG
jgi:glycosyltransferase involved in cell wall biosynthesis